MKIWNFSHCALTPYVKHMKFGMMFNVLCVVVDKE